MRIKRINIIGAFAGLLAMAGLTACNEYSLEDLHNGTFDNKSQIVLTFVTPNDGTSTRSATEDPDGYEAGIEYENTVNISAGDYKMYFFSYAEGDDKGGTLLAEFMPTEITQASTSSETKYTVTGDVPSELLSVSDFRVVMLANYGGWYPSVTAGQTTIDDLCEGDNTTYYASSKFTLSENSLIPFYGVQEYSGVTFAINDTTKLETPISLLRAVAKVEVIMTEESSVEAFDDVSIVNYNAQGYCAPKGVYVAEDYNTDYKIEPGADEWPNVFVKDLHLVNNSNDTGTKTQTFTKITSATQDTWRIYVPEYNNMSIDYSYITVTIDDVPYEIYFAEYTNGVTDNSVVTNRYNIKRDNLYRFYVTISMEEKEVTITIRVWAEKWEELFDNTYIFGVGGDDDDDDEEDDNP